MTDRIEQWKIKKLITNLENIRGAGTSMISLIIPPKDQISRINKMLTDEIGTASNIKNRINRQSVLTAIGSAQTRLKLYNKIPQNGLIIYCGNVDNEDGKNSKKVNIDFEPFKPINTFLYMCDNKFHTERLTELLETDDRFGFVIIDGSGCLFGVISGSSREVLYKFSVELPKKHDRGGQSAVRFARLRLEKRHNYVQKVSEICTQMFITNNTPNVAGLIFAGSADFKTELYQSDSLDPRLQTIVIKPLFDIQYGGEHGFSEAIELASDALSNVKLVQEKNIIGLFFNEIAKDTGKFCYGVLDTLTALEMGAVKKLIVWENLNITRFVCRNKETQKEVILYFNSQQDKHFGDLEQIESISMSEWIANNYKSFGTDLDFVTDRSQEGSQFCKGFGGLGGLLRYRVDFTEICSNDDLEDEHNFI